jgi:hypothetical protein
MNLANVPLAFLTPRRARGARPDSMGTTARRVEPGQRGEPPAEAGSAGREPAAVREAR